MEDPNLYNVSNGVQRKDADDFLVECQSLLSKINHEPEVIDVGSGDGFVTANILRRYLPKEVMGIVGVDKCKKMVDFGNTTYKDSVLHFSEMDLEMELDEQLLGKFDVVTSFYCLHWIPNQEAVIQKFYNLLDTNGLTLFCFPVSHPVYEAYKILKNNPKWSVIMKDTYKYISPYNRFEDPATECRRLMKKAGFRNIFVNNKTKTFVFFGLKQFQDFFAAINPFLKNMDEKTAEDYKNDMMNEFRKMPTIEIGHGKNNQVFSVSITYQLLEACGFK